MKAYHIKRLLKLADHLEHGKRLHKKFDFIEIASGNPKTGCKTAGCALGELPAVFPKQFKLMFDNVLDRYDVINKRCKKFPHITGSRISFKIAQSFFGIDYEEATHLFAPVQQDTHKYGGNELDCDATPKQVASNIRAFCYLMVSRGQVAK